MVAPSKDITPLLLNPQGCSFLVELSFLGGRSRLAPLPVHAVIEYPS